MKPFLYFLFFAVLYFSGCAGTQNLKTSDKFSGLKTYAWFASPYRFHNEDEKNDEALIKLHVSREMGKRGYTRDDANADIMIDYTIASKKGTEIVNRGYRMQHRTRYRKGVAIPGSNGIRLEKIPFVQDTLTIVLVDKKKDQILWIGSKENTSYDPESYGYELPKIIHTIFEDYPIATVRRK